MAEYFSHDYGARNDPKMQKLLMKLGQAGKGVFWDLVEMLYEQGGYLLLSECDSYAFALRVDCDTFTNVLNDFDLFKKDDTKFWSESVLLRIGIRKNKSVKAKESATKRWNNANAMRTQCEGNAIKGNKRKVKESKLVSGAKAPSYKLWTEQQFYDEVATYAKIYPKDLLRQFYDYWREPSPSGLMLFQLKKTWSTSLRLKNWLRMENKRPGKMPEQLNGSAPLKSLSDVH